MENWKNLNQGVAEKYLFEKRKKIAVAADYQSFWAEKLHLYIVCNRYESLYAVAWISSHNEWYQ